MKKLIVSSLSMVLLFCYTSCSQEQVQVIQSEIYIFIDITDGINKDEKLLLQGLPKILSKMKLLNESEAVKLVNGEKVNANKVGMSGGIIKFFILNETSASPYKTIKIEKGNSSILSEESNPYIREEKIQEFSDNLKTTFSEILSEFNWDTQKSKLYQQLCREVNRLSNSKAEQKIAIIYSDMLENSHIFSFYNDWNSIENWIGDKEKFDKAYQTKLSSDCKFRNLEGIEIFCVSKRNIKNDEKINSAEKFWTKLFKDYGNAKSVIFRANLDME